MTYSISDSGIKFIGDFEGLFRKGKSAQYAPRGTVLGSEDSSKIYAYVDPVGLLTIGYGHLITDAEKRSGIITINGVKVTYKNGLTMRQVMDLKKQDLARFEKALNTYIKVPLTQNMVDALISWSFNVGAGAFQTSTLARLLNQKNYNGAANEFKKWNKAGGKVLNGLTRRRAAEEALFRNGMNKVA